MASSASSATARSARQMSRSRLTSMATRSSMVPLSGSAAASTDQISSRRASGVPRPAWLRSRALVSACTRSWANCAGDTDGGSSPAAANRCPSNRKAWAGSGTSRNSNVSNTSRVSTSAPPDSSWDQTSRIRTSVNTGVLHRQPPRPPPTGRLVRVRLDGDRPELNERPDTMNRLCSSGHRSTRAGPVSPDAVCSGPCDQVFSVASDPFSTQHNSRKVVGVEPD